MSVYKKIRASYADGKSQRKIADELGIARNTVKRYCDGSSTPWEWSWHDLTGDFRPWLIFEMLYLLLCETMNQRHLASRIMQF